MNEGNNNNNEDGGPIGPAPLAIESIEDYIRRYGLPHANGEEQDGGEFNGLNRSEAIERIRAEEAYRDRVIERHQAPLQEKGNSDATRLDEEVEGTMISLILKDGSTHHIPANHLISFCETVSRMVASRRRYGVRYGLAVDTHDRNAVGESARIITSSQEEKEAVDGKCSLIELSLIEFDADAVLQFMDVTISLYDLQQEVQEKEGIYSKADEQDGSSKQSRKRRMIDEVDAIMNRHVMELVNEGRISEKNIVECLKLAHYLQCRAVLDALTSILENAIDSRNCMAICSLADTLNLTSLFESSANYVIERLDALQGTAASPLDNSEGDTVESRTPSLPSGSDNDGDQDAMEGIWSSLPYELRSRVLTMRNVMRSSVIGRGSRVSGLFFSSGNEFLAIFREAIRDQKERLAEATERREEVIRERSEEWLVRSQRRGRWFDASPEAKDRFVCGADVAYALERIERQTRRLATLELFYEEQREIFGGGGLASEIRL